MNWNKGRVINLIIISMVVFVFNAVYFPIISTREEATEAPRITENNLDIDILVESQTNVLSGTIEDLKIIMNKKNQGNIVIKGIDLSYSDTDNHVIYRAKTSYDFTLQDRYEETIHLQIPETYQLDKVAETDIPLDCTLVIYYEDDGIEECIYTSLNMRVFDSFLEQENTERVFNNEPVAIT